MTDQEITKLALFNKDKIERLVEIGVLPLFNSDVRGYNVGNSDYSKRLIQPWSIWMDWELDPWDADIIKRVQRHKKGEKKQLDYFKIIHICEEKIRQLNALEEKEKKDE